MKDNKKGGAPTKERSKNKIWIIAVAAVLAVAIAVCAALGIALAVRNSSSVMYYDGVTISEGAAAYFISRFKVDYLSAFASLGATDSDTFWSSEREGGGSYAEHFDGLATAYLKELTVTAALFDRYHRLDSNDKAIIKRSAESVLEYQAGGDKDAFNKEAEKYGFDYDSFLDAVEILYKSYNSYSMIYGTDGAGVASDRSACEEFLSEYSHVKLMFIRTEEKLVVGVNGEEELVKLSEDEIEQRELRAATLRSAILALKNNEDGQITPQMFNLYLKEYGDGDPIMDEHGYYFHEDSELTTEFAEAFPEVVNAALNMRIGEYAEVRTHLQDADENIGFEGYCFIYKYPVTEGAYADEELESWFSDFYKHASEFSYAGAIEKLVPDIRLGEKFDALSPVSVPKNTTLVLRGFEV